MTKKSPEDLRYNKYLNQACREVTGFAALLRRFELMKTKMIPWVAKPAKNSSHKKIPM